MPWYSYPALAFRGAVYRGKNNGEFDVILLSGDAYVDHPSFPTAVIARTLEQLGVSVGVICQPDWTSTTDFEAFGCPRLFFGVTSGAMDSMVANFTSMKMPRSEDRMSPGGRPGLRPKRAVTVYSQRLRQAFPGVPIILGGIEASLRRFSHFDFWENRVKDSILIDSGADMLVYGMGEIPLREITTALMNYPVSRFKEMCFPQTCIKVPPGTALQRFQKFSSNTKSPFFPQKKRCNPEQQDLEQFNNKQQDLEQCKKVRCNLENIDPQLNNSEQFFLPQSNSIFREKKCLVLPNARQCREEPKALLELSKILDSWFSPGSPILVQNHEKFDIVCFPPSHSSIDEEPGIISSGTFNRRSHPLYEENIPALVPVQFSVISHRGCFGNCTFCSLALHQGRTVRSRTSDSILKEISAFPEHPDFKGIVPDLGGPSVNMFGWKCNSGGCPNKLCTYPKKCSNLTGSLKPISDLLKMVASIKGIKKVFLGSGLRFDLIEKKDEDDYLYIVANHISGQLKVAPEHVDKNVLRLMRKAPENNFEVFVNWFYSLAKIANKKFFIVPYFMTVFPGSKDGDKNLEQFIKKLKLVHQQIQEFTPTPGTLATAMFWSGTDLNGKAIEIAKTAKKRRDSRKKIQS
ncbi:MAG: YgiQ family radical SAM protein [Candidatus Riflebacteria bacterium]|nr:YgiQ family radical SAM protein [Candidatus Riflebacteria bacterium]